MLPASALAGILTVAPMAALAETARGIEVTAPSGLAMTLDGVIVEENPWSGETLVVVRLVVPAIAGTIANPIALRDDMGWACRTWGVPAAESLSSPPDLVVVEMMAAQVERGATTPGIRRFFEQFRLQGPDCIWELF